MYNRSTYIVEKGELWLIREISEHLLATLSAVSKSPCLRGDLGGCLLHIQGV